MAYSTFFKFILLERHFLQIIKFKPIPINIGSCNILIFYAIAIRGTKCLSSVMVKNISKLTPSPRIWNVPRMWDSRITTSIFVVSNQLCGCCIKFKSDMKLHNLLNELSSGAWFGIGLSMLPYPDMKSYSSR